MWGGAWKKLAAEMTVERACDGREAGPVRRLGVSVVEWEGGRKEGMKRK